MEYLYIYLIGGFIYSISLITEGEFIEIIACVILGVIWPIHLPAMILRKLMFKQQ